MRYKFVFLLALLAIIILTIMLSLKFHNFKKDIYKRVKPGISWYWQLQGDLNLSWNVDLYDVDLFDTPKEIIEKLHKKGVIVICYFSAGTWEEWRPDAKEFPKEVIGKPLEEWKGERWLNIKKFEKFKHIILKRLDLAKKKGCDGVEPDNLDSYLHDTGFNITKEDVIKYAKWLAKEAHKRGLLIALKNCGELVKELVDYFDLAIVEECFKYNECELYLPFIQKGKPVLEVEYDLDKKEFCEKAKKLGFSSAKACYELNGCWGSCWK